MSAQERMSAILPANRLSRNGSFAEPSTPANGSVGKISRGGSFALPGDEQPTMFAGPVANGSLGDMNSRNGSFALSAAGPPTGAAMVSPTGRLSRSDYASLAATPMLQVSSAPVVLGSGHVPPQPNASITWRGSTGAPYGTRSGSPGKRPRDSTFSMAAGNAGVESLPTPGAMQSQRLGQGRVPRPSLGGGLLTPASPSMASQGVRGATRVVQRQSIGVPLAARNGPSVVVVQQRPAEVPAAKARQTQSAVPSVVVVQQRPAEVVPQQITLTPQPRMRSVYVAPPQIQAAATFVEAPDLNLVKSKLPCQQTPEAKAKLNKLFRDIDINGNGCLSYDEVDEGLRHVMGLDEFLDCKQLVWRAAQVVNACNGAWRDIMADGANKSDFRLLLQYLRGYLELRQVFSLGVTPDRDITFQGLRQALPLLADWGLLIQPTACEDIFREIGANVSGSIAFPDFADWAISQVLDKSEEDVPPQSTAPNLHQYQNDVRAMPQEQKQNGVLLFPRDQNEVYLQDDFSLLQQNQNQKRSQQDLLLLPPYRNQNFSQHDLVLLPQNLNQTMSQSQLLPFTQVPKQEVHHHHQQIHHHHHHHHGGPASSSPGSLADDSLLAKKPLYSASTALMLNRATLETTGLSPTLSALETQAVSRLDRTLEALSSPSLSRPNRMRMRENAVAANSAPPRQKALETTYSNYLRLYQDRGTNVSEFASTKVGGLPFRSDLDVLG